MEADGNSPNKKGIDLSLHFVKSDTSSFLPYDVLKSV